MAFQLSPGVNVTERDLTTIVPSVATTNAAFAGIFSWGPMHKRILIDSENSLAKTFGLPNDNNYQYWFTAANFLQYGSNLQVVRTGQTAHNACSVGASGFPVYNDDYINDASLTSQGTFIAKYPGELGNSIGVQICGSEPSVIPPPDELIGSAAVVGFADWGYADEFDAPPDTSEYVSSLNGEKDQFHLVVVDIDGKWTGLSGSVLERFANLSLDKDAKDFNGVSSFYRQQINSTSKYISCPMDGIDNTTAVIYGAEGNTSSYRYTNVESLTSGTQENGSFGVLTYKFTGGKDGTKFSDLKRSTDFVDVVFPGIPLDSGYNLFDDPQIADVNLILGGPEFCPQTVKEKDTYTSSFTAEEDEVTVGQKLKELVEKRKDCVAFLSCPISNAALSNTDKLEISKKYRNQIGSSSYVFIDSGYKYTYDIYNDKYRWVPLNGDIAGLCARTDSTNDPWYSPAGFNRGNVKGVVKLAFNPTQTFRDELYKNNINPVVTFPGEGTVLYGDKTAQTKPSAFDRINVRRLFIVLEKAIATASKYSLFEFNDAFTRAQFVSLVDPFLREVQSRRGIIDFKVVCNERNNTPEVIDSNRFVADIYIKPTRSINFIQLNFVATRTGVSFNEVGA
jgi:hypothetical protein